MRRGTGAGKLILCHLGAQREGGCLQAGRGLSDPSGWCSDLGLQCLQNVVWSPGLRYLVTVAGADQDTSHSLVGQWPSLCGCGNPQGQLLSMWAPCPADILPETREALGSHSPRQTCGLGPSQNHPGPERGEDGMGSLCPAGKRCGFHFSNDVTWTGSWMPSVS